MRLPLVRVASVVLNLPDQTAIMGSIFKSSHRRRYSSKPNPLKKKRTLIFNGSTRVFSETYSVLG